MSTQFTNRQWRLPNNENKDKQSNYSMDFDGGGSQYINFGTDVLVDSTSSFSISGWCYINNFNSISYPGIGRFKTDQSTGFFFGVSNSSGYEGVYFGSSSNFVLGKTSGDISGDFVGQWKHITIVFDGVSRTTLSSYKVYVDGSEVSTTTSGNFNAVANENRLGEGNGSNTYLDGKLDGVAIFNYPLSQSQITTLYGSSSTGIGNPMSLSPAPVAYYPLGDQDAFNGAEYLTPNASLKDFVFDFIPNDYIDCGDVPLEGVYTISFWIKPDATPSVLYFLFDKRDGSSTDISARVTQTSSNTIRFQIATTHFFSTDTLNINSWNNVVLIANGSSSKIYINNGTAATNTLATAPNTTESFFIGTDNAQQSAYFFNGKMSNVQVFNTALPETGTNSVETLYNNGSPLTLMTGFTSLQGWWKLDASATYDGSDWTIPDDSSNSNDGTSYGMTQANLVQSDLSFTSGYSPYALDFDGANDYIDCNTSLNGINSITYSVWIKPEQPSGSYGYIITAGNYSYTDRMLSIGVNTSNRKIFVYGGRSSGGIKESNFTVTYGTWYHVVIVYTNNQDVDLYVNGNPEGTIQFDDTSSIASGSPTRIGVYSGTLGNYFNGSISNVSIWNTALTSAQVTEIYSEGVPQNLLNHSAVSSLVSWWQLGSNSSFNTNWTVLDEVTASGNNGTSVNMIESDITDGVNSYANGLSNSMGGDEIIGSAPFSDANSLSVNMDVLDRVEDTPS